MKPISYFTLLLLIILSNKISAQSKFSVGGIIMPQLSMVNGDVVVDDGYFEAEGLNTYENASTSKLAYGLETVYRFSEHSGLNLSFLYSRQGQEYETYTFDPVYFGNTTSEYSTTIDYFKIPLTYEYHFSPGKRCSFFVAVGFYVAFLTEYTIQYDQEKKSDVDPYYRITHAENNSFNLKHTSSHFNIDAHSQFIEIPYNTIDYGVVFRAGVEIKLGEKLSIPVAINFDYGVTDIKNYDSKVEDFAGSGDDAEYWILRSADNLYQTLVNSTLGLRVGMRFQL